MLGNDFGVLILYFFLATLIERIVETSLSGVTFQAIAKKQRISFFIASTIGILVCIFAKLNMFDALGLYKDGVGSAIYTFYVLTGFAIGSGSQFLHELLKIKTTK